MPLIFSYGTLQDPAVQLATFHRRLSGRSDVLPAHNRVPVGPYSSAVPDPHASLEGMLFEITEEELLRADAYEAADNYRRHSVILRSGVKAWVYVHAD